MTMTTMTNDKQQATSKQATINPRSPLTIKHRKQGLANINKHHDSAIESGGAVHCVGNCMTARAHWKLWVVMQWLLWCCYSEAALETAWRCIGFGNSMAVAWATTCGEHGIAAALLTPWQCQHDDAAALPAAVTLRKMQTRCWAVVAAAAAAI